jgi:predicted ATPase/DNA-binding SARP family transcriptional activator
MRFGILGPLKVDDDGRELVLGGPRQRAVLAILLLHAREVVAGERLIDELWGEHAPASARKTVQVYVSNLRKVLGRGVLLTDAGGYRLDTRPGQIDAERFEALVDEGRRALRSEDPGLAADRLREALALWRGPALGDFAYEPFAQSESARLEEARLAALEDKIDAELATGAGAELVGELEALSQQHPLRERLSAQLMLALYRAGRQADALEAFQRARIYLADQLGLEPGHALKTLQAQILEQARALDAGLPPAGLVVPADPRPTPPPSPPTRTIGREAEIEEICGLLPQRDVRLVTLTGTGGVGKTRVALEVAHALEPSFPDAVGWIELAGVASPDDVATTIAHALALSPQPGERTRDTLCRYLSSRRMLIVIDNFEHVLEAAVLVAEMLAASNELRVLVTSREGLDVAAELRFAIEPLGVPVSADEVAASPAGALFVAAARRRDHHFELSRVTAPAVARICQVLDGLPLALELAAARAGMLGITQLAARLEEAAVDLAGGTRDAPARHRTLRKTIDWSFRLLDERDARAFVRFAVFAGGATVDAAEAVTRAALANLEALVEKNLIERRPQADGSPRLAMLETIRTYADERLTGEPDYADVRQSHADHYLGVLERAAPLLWTAREPEGLSAIDSEIDNAYAALRWALDQAPVRALRIAGSLGDYWELRGDIDGLAWLDAALQAAGDAAPPGDRARAEVGRAWQTMQRGRLADAGSAATTALELYRQLGDDAGMSEAYMALTSSTERRGNRDEAQAFAEAACEHARRSGDDRVLGKSLARLADKLPSDERQAAVEEAMRLFERTGNHRAIAHLHSNLGYKAILEGHLEDALRLLHVALDAQTKVRTPSTTMYLAGNLGLANLFTGKYAEARQAFVRQLEICAGHAFVYGADEGLIGLAATDAIDGRLERAARLFGAGDALGYFSSAPDAPVFDRLECDYFAPARERYGAAAWHQAVERGVAMPYDQAIAYALDDDSVRAAAPASHSSDRSNASNDARPRTASATSRSARSASST